MKNREWIVVAGIFALMLAGCGSGNGENGGTNGDDTTPTDDVTPDDGFPAECGDGTCNDDETCGTCVQDCGCDADVFLACRNNACVDWDAINPLLKKLPGHWARVELGYLDPDEADVNVDVDRPTCEVDGHPQGDLGDACVQGFSPPPFTISGQNLSYRSYDTSSHAEGQVLNDGTRVEFTYTSPSGMVSLIVYEKQ